MRITADYTDSLLKVSVFICKVKTNLHSCLLSLLGVLCLSLCVDTNQPEPTIDSKTGNTQLHVSIKECMIHMIKKCNNRK